MVACSGNGGKSGSGGGDGSCGDGGGSGGRGSGSGRWVLVVKVVVRAMVEKDGSGDGARDSTG